jgi:hypothetical protein
MTDSLAENFKMSFNDFRSHATNMCIFENPFSIDVSDALEKLQLELTELQYDTILCSSFNQEALITFYASLPVSRFSELWKLAQNWQVYFIAHMHVKQNKSKLKICPRITNVQTCMM